MAASAKSDRKVDSGVYKEGRNKVRDMSGLEFIAMLDAASEKIGIMRDQAFSELEIDLFTPFWDEVNQTGCRELTSYIARDGGNSLKVQFEIKRSNVALKPEEIKKLTEANVTLPAPVQKRLEINKAHANDQKVLAELEKLIELGEVHGIRLPVDFLEPASPAPVTINQDVILDVLALDFQKAVSLLPIIGKVSVKNSTLTPKIPLPKAMREIAAKVAEESKTASAA